MSLFLPFVWMYFQSEAQELTIVKMSKFGGGIGAPSKEERLKEAADIHLRLGQIQRYCELMVELGQVRSVWSAHDSLLRSVVLALMLYWRLTSSRLHLFLFNYSILSNVYYTKYKGSQPAVIKTLMLLTSGLSFSIEACNKAWLVVVETREPASETQR